MKYKYILFDLDGTLLDTNRLIIDSFRHTYKVHLDRDFTDEEILLHFGEPLDTTLRRYSEEKLQQLFATYIDFNESRHDEYVTLCPGVKESLEMLRELNCVMAVVTSKRKKIAQRGLELFDIRRHFEAMVAWEDTARHKPEPEPVLKAMELLKAVPEQTLMVGDSIFDIKCAANANVKSILVNWSAADGHQGEKISADYVVNHMKDIVDIIK